MPVRVKRLGARFHVSILIFVLFISTVWFLALNPNLTVEADPGWLAGWNYRKSHVVQNATEAGTDYQVKIKTYYNLTSAPTNPYYQLSSSWTTVTGNPADMKYFGPAHKSNIMEINKVVDGSSRKYFAYDSSADLLSIRLYYSDDLSGSWTPYSGNPILTSATAGRYAIQTAAYDGTTFHMFIDNDADNRIERWTSTDGISFTQQETMTLTHAATDYMGVYIWFNPNDSKWYLYHKQHGTPRVLWARNATDITSLGSATDVRVMDDTAAAPGTVSGAAIMYRGGKYYMVTEGVSGSVYYIWAYISSSPTSGFTACSNSPIVTSDEACPTQVLSPDGSKAYLYTCMRSSTNWYGKSREILSTFPGPAPYNPYYNLSPSWTTVTGNPNTMHNFEPVHKTNILQVDKVVDGASRKYLAYDCDPDGSLIRLFYTDNLDGSWTPYSGNPILGPSANHYRWPVVVYEGSVFHMFIDDQTDTQIERWTSTDGITFTQQEIMTITTETIYMGPYIWFNPNDSLWYLYWKQHGTPRILWARNATNIEDLDSAVDVRVMDDAQASPGTVAAECIMYRNGFYWMLTEGQAAGVWNVWAYKSTSPTSGFSICSNAPILTNGEACPVHLLSPDGSKAYLFVSRQSGSNWYQDTREIYSTFPTPQTPSSENVTCGGRCKTDFGDIRFTSGDGTTLLSYWIQEKVDSNYAIFWVKIAANLTTSSATIYMYYGKSDATTTGNGDSTFIFFDDFPGSSYDTGKWNLTQGTAPTVANSEAKLTGRTSGTRALIEGRTSFGINKVLYSKARWSTTIASSAHFCALRARMNWNYRAGDVYGSGSANGVTLETRISSSSFTQTPGTIVTPMSSHVYDVTWKAAQSTFYQDSSQVVRNTANVPTADQDVVLYEGNADTRDVYVDWVFVKKWVDPEPAHGTWGTQEEPTKTKLWMDSAKVVCRTYNESFKTRINITDASNVQGFEFEIHFNTTLLNYTNVAWGALGTGTLSANEVTGVITGSVGPSTPVTGTHWLLNITFNATYYHIWKNEATIPGWKNNQTGTIFFQGANVSYPTGPDLRYERGVLNEIEVGPDVVYTWWPIKGDVNLHGEVDISDLLAVGYYYEVTPADPRWSSAQKYELTNNSEEIIDLFDLIVIASNYGYP